MNLLTFTTCVAATTSLCFLVLSWSSNYAFAQSKNNTLNGMVFDSVTTTPIPQVNIWTRHSNTISDADGKFSLVVVKDDTVHFSHVSYYGLSIKQESKDYTSGIRIALRQKILLLAEVQVYSILSEREFKQQIIQTIPVLTREESNAQYNAKIMSYLARFAYSFPMDANDNYLEYIKGPQPVVILSSKPSKGLVRAIKNVMTPSLLSYKRFYKDSLTKSFRHQ